MSAAQSSNVTKQIRVIGALIQREMITRYGKSSLGYVWAVLEPLAVIALLSVIFSQIAHRPALGDSFVLFYATGYVAFHWFHDVSSVVARSVHVNRPLLMMPMVRPLDTILARFVLQVLTAFASATLIFAGALLFFARQVWFDLGSLLMALGLACLLGLGVGLVNCWLFAVSRSWEQIWGIISRPLFLISCVFFTFESLPGYARDVLWYNPIVHLVGHVRTGFYPIYDASHVSSVYVTSCACVLILLGLMATRFASRRLVLQ